MLRSRGGSDELGTRSLVSAVRHGAMIDAGRLCGGRPLIDQRDSNDHNVDDDDDDRLRSARRSSIDRSCPAGPGPRPTPHECLSACRSWRRPAHRVRAAGHLPETDARPGMLCAPGASSNEPVIRAVAASTLVSVVIFSTAAAARAPRRLLYFRFSVRCGRPGR